MKLLIEFEKIGGRKMLQTSSIIVVNLALPCQISVKYVAPVDQKKIKIDLWVSKWIKGKKLWWHWRGEGLYNCVHLFSFSSVTGWCQYEILNLKMRLNFLHVSRPAGTTWCTSESVSWRASVCRYQFIPWKFFLPFIVYCSYETRVHVWAH